MKFKNVDLQTGDFVAFTTNQVPLPEVQAVVYRVENNVLSVLSTFLVPFQHSGDFSEDDIQEIMVVYPAEVATPQESRGKNFRHHQRIKTIASDGNHYEGRAVAAFDGIVVMELPDGRHITRGASYFSQA